MVEERDTILRSLIIQNLLAENGKIISPDIIDTLAKNILESVKEIIDIQGVNVV